MDSVINIRKTETKAGPQCMSLATSYDGPRDQLKIQATQGIHHILEMHIQAYLPFYLESYIRLQQNSSRGAAELVLEKSIADEVTAGKEFHRGQIASSIAVSTIPMTTAFPVESFQDLRALLYRLSFFP